MTRKYTANLNHTSLTKTIHLQTYKRNLLEKYIEHLTQA